MYSSRTLRCATLVYLVAHHKLWNLPAWNVGDSTCVEAHIGMHWWIQSFCEFYPCLGVRQHPAERKNPNLLQSCRSGSVRLACLQQACIKPCKQSTGPKQLLRIRQGRQKGVSLQASRFGKSCL